MVLEALINPFTVKKKPWEMFFAGGLYSFISAFISYIAFREAAGLLTVFLITLACLPIVYTTIKNEEELDLKSDKEWKLLKEHTKVIIFLLFLFLGTVVALTTLYIFLPEKIVDKSFNIQQQAIINLNKNINDSLTGGITKVDIFASIFINNIKVLFFCIIFSFLYGTGALFILTWNASVLAASAGNFIKLEIAKGASALGLPTISAYFHGASLSFLRYMTHGLLEMAAYIFAGLAGGIISIAMIRRNLGEQKIMIDVIDLILISIGLLFVAGIIEVYVTPILVH